MLGRSDGASRLVQKIWTPVYALDDVGGSRAFSSKVWYDPEQAKLDLEVTVIAVRTIDLNW